jgi:predicted nucleic acid-binding protein
MLVVADTSPLNYLVWIEAVDLLRVLYGSIAIPPEVRGELTVPDAPDAVRAWANDLPDWVEVCLPDPGLRDDPRWRFLDLGERAALAVALARQPAILLIDERTGASVAREQRVPVVGTLGVLDEAARRQLISLPEAIERLKQTSFRYPKKIVSRLLEEDALRRRRLAGLQQE